MENCQVVSGIQLGFDKFESSEKKFKDILTIVQEAGFSDCLGANTKVYSVLVKEFYRNAVVNNDELVSRVRGERLKIDDTEINKCLGITVGDLSSLEDIDTVEGMRRMGYVKNTQLKGMKKKEFPEEFEFLAEIVGKCILCKDTAHDTVSDPQLRIMSAIVMRKNINFGAILFDLLVKEVEKIKAPGKPISKVFYGRFLSIILKRKLQDKIRDDEGEALNVHKVMSPKLFDNWKKNPMENKRLRMTSSSKKDSKESKGKRKACSSKDDSSDESLSFGFISPKSSLKKLKAEKIKSAKRQSARLQQMMKSLGNKKAGDGSPNFIDLSDESKEVPVEENVTSSESKSGSEEMFTEGTVDEVREDNVSGTLRNEEQLEETTTEPVKATKESVSKAKGSDKGKGKETLFGDKNQRDSSSENAESGSLNHHVPAAVSSSNTRRRIILEAVEKPGAMLPNKWIDHGNGQIRVASITMEDLLSKFEDIELDRTTVLYDHKGQELRRFYPWMPWLKAICFRDTSFISWCYTYFPNLKLVSQNFPRVQSFPTLLIKNVQHFKTYRHAESIFIPYSLLINQDESQKKNRPVESKAVKHPDSTTATDQSQPNIPSKSPSDIPSSSNNDFFDTITALENIFKNSTTAEAISGAEEFYKEVQASFSNISFKLLQQDQINQKSSENQQKEILKLRKNNEESIASLSEKIENLNQSLSQTIELTQQDLKIEIGNTSYLVEQLMVNFQQLSQTIDDKKGEKKRKRIRMKRMKLKEKSKKKQKRKQAKEALKARTEGEPDEDMKSSAEGET